MLISIQHREEAEERDLSFEIDTSPAYTTNMYNFVKILAHWDHQLQPLADSVALQKTMPWQSKCSRLTGLRMIDQPFEMLRRADSPLLENQSLLSVDLNPDPRLGSK
jgi:hypothetical protein